MELELGQLRLGQDVAEFAEQSWPAGLLAASLTPRPDTGGGHKESDKVSDTEPHKNCLYRYIVISSW